MSKSVLSKLALFVLHEQLNPGVTPILKKDITKLISVYDSIIGLI